MDQGVESPKKRAKRERKREGRDPNYRKSRREPSQRHGTTGVQAFTTWEEVSGAPPIVSLHWGAEA